MKAVVAAFNQEKALVGAFSVITNLRMELFEALICRCRVDVSIYTLNNNEQSQNINWKTDEVCQSAVVIVCLLRSIGTGSEHSENTSQRLHIFSFSFMFIRIDFHNPWKMISNELTTN